jgi:hypothetical protein
MNRLRRWFVVCFSVVLATGFTAAGNEPSAKPGDEKWLEDRTLTITPRAEPEPASKYRLLPTVTELKDGNAVPIYLRLNHEQTDAARKYWRDTPQPWLDLPIDQMPLADSHAYLDRMGRFLRQLDFGARRKSAEWNYTLDQPDPIGILLPDVQEMRGYSSMLALRARVQIAEHDYAAAAQSLETGFAFSRHVGNGPFLINSLVGISVAQRVAVRVREWIEQPDAPNLYWALTALPRPLISLRDQLELEQRMVELQFLDMADLDRPRSPAEWDASLKRFRAEARRIYPGFHLSEGLYAGPPPKPGDKPTQPTRERREGLPTDPNEPAAKSPDLAAARTFVARETGKSVEEVAAMPPAQVLLLYIHGTYARYRDDLHKLTYLPFPEAQPRETEFANRLKASGDSEGERLAREFLPGTTKVMVGQNGLERRLALLRAIEALRIYAATHDGQLPDSLDQVTAAPVPPDPGTGKPFEYHRSGATATLISRLPGETQEGTRLRYRITMRSK